ncbi:unnamed protein product [Dibothriocephalus latus]|uniref:Uncharacterized protein n=1 Tax=Dibothriocephalus latus TaxID=60516 RepID=A0A3P7MW54_DIBLA|nr:unnamed protein product [Dibothriocephalus latus]
MAVIMLDLAGLNDVTDDTIPRVTIGGSGSRKPHLSSSSPTMETENRRSKNSFHVLTNGVEPNLQLPTSSTPPGWLQRWIEGRVAKLMRRRWLSVALAEFKYPSLCEYLVRTSTPSAESGLVGPRLRVMHKPEAPKNNSENLRNDVDTLYRGSLEPCLISLLVKRYKDT